ncbi:MAG TPA: DUF1254 domain-containing protein [Bacteroidetes bacterium]|nr:DUF1254 domain-containing protein [Bacteroidota bacterium]
MKKTLLYLVFFIGGIYFGKTCSLKYFPNLVFYKNKKRHGTENRFKYSELPTEYSLPFQNPDFIYASCYYDLKKGPLRIRGELPWFTYWSLALYEPDTNNFFIKNDRGFDNNEVDIVLSRNKIEGIKEENNIISPTNEGYILFRILVTEKMPEKTGNYTAFQRSIKIETNK